MTPSRSKVCTEAASLVTMLATASHAARRIAELVLCSCGGWRGVGGIEGKFGKHKLEVRSFTEKQIFLLFIPLKNAKDSYRRELPGKARRRGVVGGGCVRAQTPCPPPARCEPRWATQRPATAASSRADSDAAAPSHDSSCTCPTCGRCNWDWEL
jgi:hypothetical protein